MVANNKIQPIPGFDAITAGNANMVRNEQFNPLRDVLAAAAGASQGLAGSLGQVSTSSFNTAILYDLVAIGDGGLFTERIIVPMFQALAFELSTKGGHGCASSQLD